ncbi:hypothetical protein SEA_FLORAL_61 [Gordonia phage Floral]|nr:hypothetical protein SEA_POLLUX_63 [Gordonia phage Pollux]QAY17663.1 hypothetical protein SEA_EMSQUAREDA_60 [Gordonia phage EMsquaredA]QDP45143.1 hypothetical protein SEA_MARTEENA_59 [Gordonia phage Marteena]QZD97193.1 hypothetical protein SEA_FLORAL_61 [Gordonia phage Floral]
MSDTNAEPDTPAKGDQVQYQGRDYTILTVTDLHYGLVDETRPPIVDDQNGQQVAHLAVRHNDVERVTS